MSLRTSARSLFVALVAVVSVLLGTVTSVGAAPEPGAQADPVPELPPQELKDDYSQFSPGLRLLLEDLRAGEINRQPFANHAYAKLGFQGHNPPKRYRDDELPEGERAVLALALSNVLETLPHSVRNGIRNRVTNHAFKDGNYPPAQSAPSSAQNEPSPGTLNHVPPTQCGTTLKAGMVGDFKCKHGTRNFDLWYNLDGDRPVDGDDGASPGVGIPHDGIPNYIQRAAVSFEEALHTYQQLGYQRPNNDRILVFFGPNGFESKDAFTPPTEIIGRSAIYMGHEADEWSTARHEVFHVIQYAYKPPVTVENLPGNVIPLQSWQETTAEWATHQAVKNDPNVPASHRYAYAANIADFLGRPREALTQWDGLAKGRQYGGFIFAEFLEERFDADIIRQIWERIDTAENAHPAVMVAEAVAARGSTIISEMIAFGKASYQLCGEVRGGHSGDPWGGFWHMSDPDIGAWCDILDRDSRTTARDPFSNIPRPASTVVQLSGDGRASGEVTVHPGGSAYVDIAVPGPTTTGAWQSWLVGVKANVEQQVGRVQLTVIKWSDFPSRRFEEDWAATPVPESNTAFAAGPCAGQGQMATLVFTHFRADLVDHREPPAKVRWETEFLRQDAAGITNGTVTLGVNEHGALNEGGCVPSSGDGTTSVGLRYLPTGAEGLAHSQDSDGTCHCEGWGVRAILPEGKGSYSGWSRRWVAAPDDDAEVQPISFTSNESGARSVVDVKSKAGLGTLRVTQEFRPSKQKELFEVLVTVVASGKPYEMPHVTFRRVMNWHAEPTGGQEYVTVQAPDSRVEYSSDDGFASLDPASGRTKIREDGSFTDAGPYDQGALFDFAVPMEQVSAERSIGRIRLYYGAADDQPAAIAAFGGLGIDTYSIAKPVTAGDPGTPNTFMFGFRP